MKKYAIIAFLIIPNIISSQELNQAFLDSLPNDIQEDVVAKLNEQGSIEEPVYRSIETQTELEKIELFDLKKRLEADLQYLERRLSDDAENLKDKYDLDLFGKNFFSTYQSTYMPINEPNLNPNYELDYGDILEVQLIGQRDVTEAYQLKRDGSINIPEIGPLMLGGMTLADASALISAKINSSFIGTQAFVTLTNLRDINVLVSGNAFNPGIYTVSGNSNMLHVLGVAGGINDFGSYREIQLIRNKEVIETLDMYDILITGKYNSKTSLKTGDVIFIKPQKEIITVTGAVRMPAKYELKDDQNLYEALEYANGIAINADLSNVYLDRILDGKTKSLPIRNINQYKDINANDGDIIYIRKHTFRSVNITGAVLKPGKYLLAEGESLEDLINKSGGFIETAYPFGAVYENEDALVINKMAKNKIYEAFIDNIITASQKNPTGNMDLTAVIELTNNLKNTKPNGRVVIDVLDEESSKSLILKDGDEITIPEKPDHIYIYGEVNYEGALKFVNNVDVEFYINKSGGLKKNAQKDSIYVLQPNGETERYILGRKNIFQNQPSNEQMILHPGSVIFVPRGIDNSASNRLAAQAYVSILGNIGIALASLSSINNN